MKELGSSAPDFRLPEPATGKILELGDFAGFDGLLVMFICNHCPFVKHVRDELARLGRDFQNSKIGIVAINSNDATNYPEDSPDQMVTEVSSAGYVFPYLFDEAQHVARAFDAACTPDFFLYDRDRKLVYRGQLDDSRPGNGLPVTGRDLRNAMNLLINKKPISIDQRPSLGCNIKWR